LNLIKREKELTLNYMLVLVLSLSVAGCGGSSDYDDDIPAEVRAIIRDFLASWAAEEPDARLMVAEGKTPFAYPFTTNIYGYIGATNMRI